MLEDTWVPQATEPQRQSWSPSQHQQVDQQTSIDQQVDLYSWSYHNLVQQYKTELVSLNKIYVSTNSIYLNLYKNIYDEH